MSGISEQLALRTSARDSLTELYRQAERCERLHVEAGLPVPGEVDGLLRGGEGKAKSIQKPVTPPQKPERALLPPPYPPLQPGWISIPADHALPMTMIQVVLANAEKPMSHAGLADRIRQFHPGVRETSLYGIASKLSRAGILLSVGRRFMLADPAKAPVLMDGRIHGPRDGFQLQEVAHHRREAIRAYLDAYGPLGRAELVDLLQRSTWVNAPTVVSLVKADLEAMQVAGIVQRNSAEANVWNWELVDKRKGQANLRLA